MGRSIAFMLVQFHWTSMDASRHALKIRARGQLKVFSWARWSAGEQDCLKQLGKQAEPIHRWVLPSTISSLQSSPPASSQGENRFPAWNHSFMTKRTRMHAIYSNYIYTEWLHPLGWRQPLERTIHDRAENKQTQNKRKQEHGRTVKCEQSIAVHVKWSRVKPSSALKKKLMLAT